MTAVVETTRCRRVLTIEGSRNIVVRTSGRAIHVAAILAVREGIAKAYESRTTRGEDTAVEVFGQQHRCVVAAEAAGIGQHQFVFTCGGEAGCVDTCEGWSRISRNELRRTTSIAGVDRHIDRATINGEACTPAAEFRNLRQVNDGERVLVLAVDVIEREIPSAKETGFSEVQFRIEAEVRTKHRRHFDVGINRLCETETTVSRVDCCLTEAAGNAGEAAAGYDVNLACRASRSLGGA